MIISASYKTDIPAFYGKWFMNRVRAGYCKMTNPYNKRTIRVSLAPSDVDGLVFWTKNLGPFLPYLRELKSIGFPFVIQYTINGYPRILECSVVNAARSIEHMRRISDEFGPRVCVWRYDTIIISSVTQIDFHLKNFESLCQNLKGTTDEVVISFMQLYQKTIRNMNSVAKTSDFRWEEPSTDVKRQIVSKMVFIAQAHGIQLSVCAQRNLIVDGAADARCIDAIRLGNIAGRIVSAPLRGGRKECGCYAACDIGEYDTCPHGCVYCYAVLDRELAQKRYNEHDPESEFLFRIPAMKDPEPEADSNVQLALFDESSLETRRGSE